MTGGLNLLWTLRPRLQKFLWRFSRRSRTLLSLVWAGLNEKIKIAAHLPLQSPPPPHTHTLSIYSCQNLSEVGGGGGGGRRHSCWWVSVVTSGPTVAQQSQSRPITGLCSEWFFSSVCRFLHFLYFFTIDYIISFLLTFMVQLENINLQLHIFQKGRLENNVYMVNSII